MRLLHAVGMEGKVQGSKFRREKDLCLKFKKVILFGL
jgi:hypothetical protein